MCELHEGVRGIMYHVYAVRRGKVTGSLQMMFMGRGGSRGIREIYNSVSHLSFLTGRI
jgi:hypothetical protein